MDKLLINDLKRIRLAGLHMDCQLDDRVCASTKCLSSPILIGPVVQVRRLSIRMQNMRTWHTAIEKMESLQG